MDAPTLVSTAVGLLVAVSSAVFPVVVARYDHLHTATNYHISALSVSDCIIGAVMTVYPITREVMPDLGHSPGMCVTILFFYIFCSTMSNGIMFWLVWDRCTAIHHPLTYPLLVTSATVRWELLITALSALTLVFFVITMQLLTGPPLPDVIPKCFASWYLVMDYGNLLLNVVNLVIICVTLVLCLHVLVVSRRVLRSGVVALPHELTERARLRQHMRTFYYLLRVFVLYGVCLIPFSIYSLARTALDMPVHNEDPDPLWGAVILLRGMYNLFDSWLYCSDPEIRQAILHFCWGSHFELYP